MSKKEDKKEKSEGAPAKFAPIIFHIYGPRAGLSKLEHNAFTLIAGMTNSGKTNLLQWYLSLYYPLGIWNKIRMICPTAANQDAYSKMFSEEMIIKDPSAGDIQKLMDEADEDPALNTLLILDDCIGHSTFRMRNSNIFDRLSTSCRHYRITVFCLVQDLKKVTPTTRDNARHLFLTKVKSRSLEAAMEMSSFNNKAQFIDFIERAMIAYQVIRFDTGATPTHPFLVFKPGKAPHITLSDREDE